MNMRMMVATGLRRGHRIPSELDHLWVEEYEAPGEDQPGVLWTVFDPEGRVLGVQVWRLERSGG